MKNLSGTPIWYELMTKDPMAARRFYGEVVGWQINEVPPAASIDYRMISAADGLVGGMLTLTDAMSQHGAAPCWLMYIGVDDVDACVGSVLAAGGAILMPAFDMRCRTHRNAGRSAGRAVLCHARRHR